MSGSAAIRVLVITDLVGSTALITELGDRRAAEIFEAVDALTRKLLVERDGLEIDRTDGFLLLFEDVLPAARFTQALHRGLAEVGEKAGIGALEARAGIHLGSVILRKNAPDAVQRGAKPIEVEGLTKPLTARIMSSATGGQTLLSAAAFDLLQRATVGEPEAELWAFARHGPRRFKGIDQPVDVCEISEKSVAPEAATPVPRARSPRARWAVLPLVLAAAAAGIWAATQGWLGRVQVRTVHSWDVDSRFGLPALVSPGSEAEPLVPGVRYTRVSLAGGKLQEVLHVNHLGHRVGRTFGELDPPDFPVPLRIGAHKTRAGNAQKRGTVRDKWADDSLGNPFEGHVYDDALVGSFHHQRIVRYSDDEATTEYLNPDGSVQIRSDQYRDEGGTVREGGWSWDVDDRGRVLHRWFTYDDDREHPVHSLFRYDGNKTTERQEDAAGNLAPKERAPIEERISATPDHPNALASTRWFDQRSEPTMGKQGCAERRWTHDERGRVVMSSCIGLDGELTRRRDNHCAQMRSEWDGSEVRTTCYGPDENPQPTVDNWVQRLGRYDDAGQLAYIAHFDADGEPVDASDGWASAEFRHTTDGFLVGLGPYLDAKGSPVRRDDGSWALALRRDERGRVHQVERLDANGQPIAGVDGATTWRYRYDHEDRLVEMAALNAHGTPVPTRDGTAGARLQISEAGHLASVRFFGIDGQPIAHRHVGAARLDLERGPEHNRILARSCFDGSDNPVLCPVLPWFYSANLRERRSAQNAHLQMPSDPPLCHRVRHTYEETGEASGFACDGIDGKPRVTRKGWSAATWTSRQMQNQTLRFLGPDGELIDTTYGFAQRVLLVNAAGVREDHTLADGSPGSSLRNGGCSTVEQHNDERGRMVEQRCLGPNGELQRRSDTNCAMTRVTYSDTERYRDQACLDEHARPTPIMYNGVEAESVARSYYDSTWRETRIEALDSAGNLVFTPRLEAASLDVERPGPGHSVETARDPAGRILWRGTARRDADGNLMSLSRWGVDLGPPDDSELPHKEYERDALGRELVSRATDHDGNPIPLRDGTTATRRETRYDADGSKLLRYFDAQDRPARLNGCFALRLAYVTGTKQLTARTCLNAALEVEDPFHTDGKQGMAVTRLSWDPLGRIDGAYFETAAGGAAEGMYSAVEIERTLMGEMTSMRTTDAEGRLVNRDDHEVRFGSLQVEAGPFAEVRWKRDAMDRPTRQEHLGPDGEAAPGPEGWSRWEGTRDRKGRLIEERWFDASGAPVDGPHGCPRWVRHFTPSGNIADERCE